MWSKKGDFQVIDIFMLIANFSVTSIICSRNTVIFLNIWWRMVYAKGWTEPVWFKFADPLLPWFWETTWFSRVCPLKQEFSHLALPISYRKKSFSVVLLSNICKTVLAIWIALLHSSTDWLMVHSDFIAMHRSTSPNASLSQQLCALRIFVRVTWVATQKTSIGRRRPMQNDRSLNAPLHFKRINNDLSQIHIHTLVNIPNQYCD